MRPEELKILEDLKKVFADLKSKKPVEVLDEFIKKKESEKEKSENKLFDAQEGKSSEQEEKENSSEKDKAKKSDKETSDYNKPFTQYFEHPLIYSGPKPTATHTENYREGDSALFVPGTYLQIFRQHEYLMGSGLFGYTTPSMGFNVVVRGDLKGEPFRDVRSHEAYHWTQRAGELDTRDATGTHMDVFLPKLQKMYSGI